MHFSFLAFGHFLRQSYDNTKILHLHFARQDRPDEKKWKENHATEVNKIPKTKRRKYGMNKKIVSSLHKNLFTNDHAHIKFNV